MGSEQLDEFWSGWWSFSLLTQHTFVSRIQTRGTSGGECSRYEAAGRASPQSVDHPQLSDVRLESTGPDQQPRGTEPQNHVQATVENCVFRDNEICFRVRGGAGERGGAYVTIVNCAVYDSLVAVRAEDRIENLKIRRLGIGHGVERKLHTVSGGLGSGYENLHEHVPPPYQAVQEKGLPR